MDSRIRNRRESGAVNPDFGRGSGRGGAHSGAHPEEDASGKGSAHSAAVQPCRRLPQLVQTLAGVLAACLVASVGLGAGIADGPGGPILVVSGAGNPFGSYYAEILRAEGLNEFSVTDIAQVTAPLLSAYDLVVLANLPLNSVQANMFADWVNGGGNLIAMRPDKQLTVCNR